MRPVTLSVIHLGEHHPLPLEHLDRDEVEAGPLVVMEPEGRSDPLVVVQSLQERLSGLSHATDVLRPLPSSAERRQSKGYHGNQNG